MQPGLHTQKHFALFATVLVFLGAFYVSLTQTTPWFSLFLTAMLAVICFRWPNTGVLLVFPGLLPAANVDLGFGSTPLRLIVLAALVGQTLRRQWIPSRQRSIRTLIWFGWSLLILSLITSTFVNDQQLVPGIFVWLMRLVTMSVYISAWQFCRHPEFGLWGWVLVGALMIIAAPYVYSESNSVLAVRGNYEYILGQTVVSDYAIAILFLTVSGLVVVSFWAAWTLRALRTWSAGQVILYSIALAFPLLMSGRRQALLGMLLALVCLVFAIQGRAKWTILLIVVLATGLLYSSGMLTEFLQGRESIEDELAGAGTGRLLIYSVGVDSFLKNPIWGTGLGSYTEITLAAGLVAQETGEGVASHNTVIGVAVEAGIFGVLGLMCILSGCFWSAVVILKRTRGRNGWAYTFPILGYTIAGLLVSNVIEGQWYLLSLAMLCGIAARLEVAENERLI